jgi:hypothetical protein
VKSLDNITLAYSPAPVHTYTVEEAVVNLSQQIMDKFLYFGIVMLIAGLWNMFVRTNAETNKSRDIFTFTLDVSLIVGGLMSIGFYMLKVGWLRGL